MRRAAIWGACALCVVAVTTAVGQQYDDSSYDRDYEGSRYDRGTDQSFRSDGQSRSDMYSDRGRDSSWYGQRGTGREDTWRSGSQSGQSQYGRDYDGRYGYRGDSDYDEWSTDRGMQQGTGQQWRQRGQDWGTEDWRSSRQQMGQTGRGQSVAVVGRLTREDAQISGVNPDHKVVQIQTRQGNTLYVDLGPSDQAQDLNLSQNQSIFAHGQLTNVGGQRVLMARQVARVSQLTNISRTDEGFGQQQRSRDIYGYQDDTGTSGQSQFGQSGKSSQFRSGQSGQSQFRSGQSDTSGQSSQLRSGQSDTSGQSSQWNQSGSSGQSSGGSGQSSGSGQSGSSGSSNR